jgi:hypothetical protein
MKKAAIICLALGIISLASSATTNPNVKESTNGCTAGLTTCGLEFMVCDQIGDFTPEEAWIIYSNMNYQLCGEWP